jgi:hypothetical protein
MIKNTKSFFFFDLLIKLIFLFKLFVLDEKVDVNHFIKKNQTIVVVFFLSTYLRNKLSTERIFFSYSLGSY